MKTLFFMFVNMCYSIDCWHCDAKSPMECVLYGSSRTCPGRDDICFVEQRQRKGKLLRVRQGCQQNNACEVQKRQNFQTRIITKTNCRPESFLRWPSSVCRQCCYTNNCGATWTPQSRSEWAMDMVDATEAEYSFQFIFDYDY